MKSAGRLPSPAAGGVLALLALYYASQYGDAFGVPFINDDFLFLDRTRGASFLSLWGTRGLAFHWYRPWSRELQYWLIPRLFGVHEWPFHLLAAGLWLGILGLYFTLVRRRAGGVAASIAVAGVAALAAWGVPLMWVAGIQELWMLFWALVALHALDRARGTWAGVATALALLSKETAAVLPALALAHGLVLERRTPGEALRRAAPVLAVTAVWALVHPLLLGRLWVGPPPPAPEGLHSGFVSVATRTLLMPVNFDALPRPEYGWGRVVAQMLAGAILLAAIVVLGLRAAGGAPAFVRPRSGTASPSPGFGVVWALLGWLPLLVPSIGWHAYYALFGALGLWWALGILLAGSPAQALLIVAALGVLRPAQAATVSRDWGSEWYQRRAAEFLRAMRTDLLRKQPTPPAHSRLYFVAVPSNVGFLPGDAPSLRVWYRDPTLSGGLYSSYQPRAAADSLGRDFFFRYDSLSGWIEVVHGPEDASRARRANPRWEQDHATLGTTLARAGDMAGARLEFEKLASATPANPEYAFAAGMLAEGVGDSAAANRWFQRAALSPAADDTMRAVAKEYRRAWRRRAP